MNPLSFHCLQAEAFIGWRDRLPEDPDPVSSFEFWSAGKDFNFKDKLAIKALVSDLLQRRASGEMLHDCLTFNLIGAPEGGSKS